MLDLRIAGKTFISTDRVSSHVLGSIRFSVLAGEIVAILGRSGTGKSTLLRILLGLDTDFEGTVSRRSERVGVMLQEPRLLPWLTVRDNLWLVAPEREQEIPALLQEVQLPATDSLYPRQLSLGMSRRVSLARALAVSPDLLVLDEPFASLDAQLAAQLAGVVGRWTRRNGGAVVLATHDLGQTLEFASRILVLSGQPAILAADIAVPSDAASRLALHGSLITRFGFLDAGERADG